MRGERGMQAILMWPDVSVREENNETLISKLGERVTKFQEAMEVERKVNLSFFILLLTIQIKEETENVLFKLLEDIDNSFKNELNVSV